MLSRRVRERRMRGGSINHRFPLMTLQPGDVKDVWAAVRDAKAPPGGGSHLTEGGLLRREDTWLAPSRTSV